MCIPMYGHIHIHIYVLGVGEVERVKLMIMEDMESSPAQDLCFSLINK